MKTHAVQQTKHQFGIISVDTLIFEIQENGWDLSMMRKSYNLTKRKTKTEKFEKFLQMSNIINFDYSL